MLRSSVIEDFLWVYLGAEGLANSLPLHDQSLESRSPLETNVFFFNIFLWRFVLWLVASERKLRFSQVACVYRGFLPDRGGAKPSNGTEGIAYGPRTIRTTYKHCAK